MILGHVKCRLGQKHCPDLFQHCCRTQCGAWLYYFYGAAECMHQHSGTWWGQVFSNHSKWMRFKCLCGWWLGWHICKMWEHMLDSVQQDAIWKYGLLECHKWRMWHERHGMEAFKHHWWMCEEGWYHFRLSACRLLQVWWMKVCTAMLQWSQCIWFLQNEKMTLYGWPCSWLGWSCWWMRMSLHLWACCWNFATGGAQEWVRINGVQEEWVEATQWMEWS